jgi:hypothetical protein
VAEKTVDQYLEGLEPWQADIARELRTILQKAAPGAKESFKWAQPVYESNGPFAYIKAFKNAVNFGFWRGVDLRDPKGVLQGSGGKMRHIKLSQLADIDAELFSELIRQAIELNSKKGDPTKRA